MAQTATFHFVSFMPKAELRQQLYGNSEGTKYLKYRGLCMHNGTMVEDSTIFETLDI